jgi:hypothetical protein
MEQLPSRRELARAHSWRQPRSPRWSPPLSWHWATCWRRVVHGVVLGSFFYLITSCYYEQRLDQPKFERGRTPLQRYP